MNQRTEFGFARTVCACFGCRLNCNHMPGLLVPADLDRLLPAGVDPFAWAEANLLVSPGSVVMNSTSKATLRIPSLVPAQKADGSCIYLDAQENCTIHTNAPYGCAFFDCSMGPNSDRMFAALRAVAQALGNPESLYCRIVMHLVDKQRVSQPPELKRTIMTLKDPRCGDCRHGRCCGACECCHP